MMKRLVRFSLSLIILLQVLTACSKDDDPILNPDPTPAPVSPGDEPADTTQTDTVAPVVSSMVVPVMRITTQGRQSIDSREHYLACDIQIEGMGQYDDYQTTFDDKDQETDSIRGRGNSTWLWYDKKPYKLKLGRKASLLGIPEGKKYVLLANYRDPTRMMNAVTFDVARYMGLPFTNTNRFVEVYLNDRYIGLYQLTEQVEQGKGRVAIDKKEGLLLSLDLDDGPTEQPHANDNFLSKVFSSSYSPHGLPVCVKHPEHLTSEQLQTIRDEFGELEQVIKEKDYQRLQQICDVQSMMDFLIIQELTRNVELVTPRSMYIYRDADRIWRFGPVWDFDGGFAYDWGERHEYFGSQSWMMGPQGDRDIPDFFDRMFQHADFLRDYKARFAAVGSQSVHYALDEMTLRLDSLSTAIERDEKAWPTNKRCLHECTRLKTWLNLRVMRYSDYLHSWK